MTDDLRLHEIIDEAVALIGTDLLYLERDPAGVQLDMKVPVSVLDSHFEAGAPVQSVFGRIGAVVAVDDDYTALQVANTPAGDIVATTVQGAIDELDAEKQPLDAGLASIAGLTTAADKMIYTSALDTYVVTDLTPFARTLLDDVDAPTARATLSLGTMAVEAAADYVEVAGDTMTGALKINANSATALLVEQDGVNNDVLVVDTANLHVAINHPTPSALGGNAVLHAVSRDNSTNAIIRAHAANLTQSIALNFASLLVAGSNASINISVLAKGGSGFIFLGRDTQNTGIRFSPVDGGLNHIWNADQDLGITVNSPKRVFLSKTSTPVDGLTVDTATGFVGVGVGNATPATKFHAVIEDAATATVTTVATLGHNSSDTPAANFGTGLNLEGKSSTTADQAMGSIATTWFDATHATFKGDLIGYANDANGQREIWRGRANGSAAAWAVLGATPIVRQAHIVDADGTLADITTKFNALLAYFENFGYIATA